MKIGICGVGFVGNAILQYLDNFMDMNLTDFSVIIYDKYRNINVLLDLIDTDFLFICLPTQYDHFIQGYDMSEVDQTLIDLAWHKYAGIILIKSTVLPTYCSSRNKIYSDLRLCHNPEFLTARTAVDDFAKQSQIVLGFTEQSRHTQATLQEFYETLFPFAQISITTSECSALMKLACNSFYATKVQYFTELYLLCEKLNVPYVEVKNLMLTNQWINPQHTQVPGPDGEISFGGSCLPKDLAALNDFMRELGCSQQVIQAVIDERQHMRTKN
jgi:nucleotide sugar dehydrogenase